MTDPSATTRYADPNSGFRIRSWHHIVVMIVSFLLVLYVGSYYHLSRRGMQEAKLYGMKGFLYEPAMEVFEKKDLTRHHNLAALYAPLNWLEQKLLGNEGPVRCILWGLSK